MYDTHINKVGVVQSKVGTLTIALLVTSVSYPCYSGSLLLFTDMMMMVNHRRNDDDNNSNLITSLPRILHDGKGEKGQC